MAEQFEVTQQEVEYRPTEATNFVREFDNFIAERDELNKTLRGESSEPCTSNRSRMLTRK